MRDLVIIPTFSRPEMLQHCLEHLMAVPEIGDFDRAVFVDNHIMRPPPLAEIAIVLGKFSEVTMSLRPPNPYRGNSSNIMLAYAGAFEEGRERVFLVEDDVMVEPGFFRWHLETQREKLFCSIGISRPGVARTTEMYASLGVCFSRESLGLIVPHAVPEYFRNMNQYCAKHFRGGPNVGTEQDGLILRIMKQAKGTAIFADPPVARHIGWYGYNRGLHARPKGTLQERYAAVAERVTRTVV